MNLGKYWRTNTCTTRKITISRQTRATVFGWKHMPPSLIRWSGLKKKSACLNPKSFWKVAKHQKYRSLTFFPTLGTIGICRLQPTTYLETFITTIWLETFYIICAAIAKERKNLNHLPC